MVLNSCSCTGAASMPSSAHRARQSCMALWASSARAAAAQLHAWPPPISGQPTGVFIFSEVHDVWSPSLSSQTDALLHSTLTFFSF